MTDVMIVASVFIYCYLVFVIFTIKKSFIDYVIRNKTSIKEFRTIWMEVIAIQDTLEESLSTIPFPLDCDTVHECDFSRGVLVPTKRSGSG